MSKAVLCLSGGLDSCVLLWHLKHTATITEIRCLSVNYGQRHWRELEAAKSVALAAGVEHRILDLGNIKPLLAGSSQTDSVDVPEGHYASENMKLTVVPNRNMILLSLAGAWAVATKSDIVAYAAHAGDHEIYPDCRPSFIRCIGDALGQCDWHKLSLWVPFMEWDKAQIAAHGVDLKAPLHLTRTCYKGWTKACGKCGSCVERLSSFAQIKTEDPIDYEDREYYKTVTK